MKKNLLVLILFVFSTQIIFGQWRECNLGYYGGNTTAFAIRENNIFAGSMENSVYLSTDYGDHWSLKDIGLTCDLTTALAFNGNNLFYGADCEGGVFLSTDNGETWKQKNNGLAFIYVLTLASCENYIIAGSFSGPLFSSNSGDSWTNKYKGLASSMVLSLATSGKDIFAGTSRGVFLSSDYGENWVEKNIGLTYKYILSMTVNGNSIFAGTKDGGVFLSTNRGDSWKIINKGLPNSDVNSIVTISNYLFAGTDDGLYFSSDNGVSWIAKNKGLPNNRILSIAIKDNYIFAGVYMNGIFKANINDLITDIRNETESLFFRIFPNPVKENLILDFLMDINEKISIKIQNTLSKIVYVMENIYSTGNNNPININTSNLSQGVYFLTFQAGNIKETKKFVIIR